MNRDPGRTDGGSDNDRTLIRDFLSGNRSAFDRLLLRHKDRVFSLCYRFLGDYQEAEDSSQDVFVKVYTSLKRFRFESSFSTWLYRIVFNTCMNKLNSLKYRFAKGSVSLKDLENRREGAQEREIRDDGPTPAMELERKERMELIQEAINSLPPRQKVAVILRDIQGLSYEEIADITGWNIGTIKSRIARARLGLRDRLRGQI